VASWHIAVVWNNDAMGNPATSIYPCDYVMIATKELLFAACIVLGDGEDIKIHSKKCIVLGVAKRKQKYILGSPQALEFSFLCGPATRYRV
jgi:hypothetical protein